MDAKNPHVRWDTRGSTRYIINGDELDVEYVAINDGFNGQEEDEDD